MDSNLLGTFSDVEKMLQNFEYQVSGYNFNTVKIPEIFSQIIDKLLNLNSFIKTVRKNLV